MKKIVLMVAFILCSIAVMAQRSQHFAMLTVYEISGGSSITFTSTDPAFPSKVYEFESIFGGMGRVKKDRLLIADNFTMEKLDELAKTGWRIQNVSTSMARSTEVPQSMHVTKYFLVREISPSSAPATKP